MTVRVLSLGAGVQSTTLALMIAHGEVEPVDCAIFADTQAETAATYEHLRWLMSPNVLPFPVHVVTAGNILDNLDAMTRGGRWASIPAWVLGDDGRAAPIPRQCTKEFKLEPIHAKVRGLVGLKPGQSFRHALGIGPRDEAPILVRQLIGFSRDEVGRIKPSEHDWIEKVYPLVDLGMDRQDCERWLTQHEYPIPPKSSCFFCPFRENERWRELRARQPEEWRKAIEVDRLIADGAPDTATRAGTKPMYLHRSLRRLEDVDLSDLFADAGGFNNECEGMCGV